MRKLRRSLWLWIFFGFSFFVSIAHAQNHVLSLDGDGDYMTSSARQQLSGDTSFTVSFWMKYTPMPNRMWIMDIGERGAPYRNVHWLIPPDGMVQFGFWGGSEFLWELFLSRKVGLCLNGLRFHLEKPQNILKWNLGRKRSCGWHSKLAFG